MIRFLTWMCIRAGICVILLSTAAYFAERGVMCDEGNNFCSGTAEPKFGLSGSTPETGWYALRGSFDGATYSAGCENAAFCRRKSEMDSIPMAVYWCVQTITTTGYGDIIPETIIGKIAGVLVMLMGLVMLALPITIISENFALEYQRKELMRLDELEKKERMFMDKKKRDRERRRQKLLSVVAMNRQGQDGEMNIFNMHEQLQSRLALLIRSEMWFNGSQEELPRSAGEKKHRPIK
jgi:hypothetical protein